MFLHLPLQLSPVTPLILLSFNELWTLLFCSYKAAMSWDASENFLWWFSFFWTTSDLLSPLIVLLCSIWVHYYDQLGLKFWFLLIRVGAFLLLAHEVCISNVASEIWYYVETTFPQNNFLSNQLNKIHPPLFYALMGWLLGISFFSIERRNRFSPSPIPTLLLLNLLLLLLGSWWAFQEGTWGGWWNWDSSEVLGLIILILLISNLHGLFLDISKLNSHILLLLRKTLSIVSMIAFLLLQLTLVQSSHSFGIQFDYLFLRDTSITQELGFLLSLFFMHQMRVVRLLRNVKLTLLQKWMTYENFFYPIFLLIIIIVFIPFLPLAFKNYVYICKDLTWVFHLGYLVSLFTTMMLTTLVAVYGNLKMNLAALPMFFISVSIFPLWNVVIILGNLPLIRGFVHYLFCLTTLFVVVFQSLLPPVWDFSSVENLLITPLNCRDAFTIMRQAGNVETMSLAFTNFDGSPLFLLSVTLVVVLCLIIIFL